MGTGPDLKTSKTIVLLFGMWARWTLSGSRAHRPSFETCCCVAWPHWPPRASEPAYRLATAEELRADVDLIHGPETAAIVVDMHHEKHGDYAAILAVVHVDDAKVDSERHERNRRHCVRAGDDEPAQTS